MIRLMIGGSEHAVEIIARRPQLVLSVDGQHHVVEVIAGAGDGIQTLRIDGQTMAFRRAVADDAVWLRIAGRTEAVTPIDPFAREQDKGAGGDDVRAPMPGLVVDVHGAVGAAVARGAALITIESMKLQTVLCAPRDGVIAAVTRQPGDLFARDDVLVRLEPVVVGE
ncbi:biotin/lipoyl-containing protein [Novosphingobium sp.]|uniref:acetyl-CoA carboxylase biotin carboxyl carrier protein subunit n=1 Tax=Novosphingobium sp. TaxID=1874826 RepID=UPI003342638E